MVSESASINAQELGDNPQERLKILILKRIFFSVGDLLRKGWTGVEGSSSAPPGSCPVARILAADLLDNLAF